MLIIGWDDDNDCSVWLLDAEGRTEGPLWDDLLDEASAKAAANEAKRIIDRTPSGVAFTKWPPVARDFAAEKAMNEAWRGVREHIDGIRLLSSNEASIQNAIESSDRYIDLHLSKSHAADLVPGLAKVFKAQAASLIRAKAGSQ